MIKKQALQQYGGPCKRQCKVDNKTMVCTSCKMYFGKPK